MPNIFINLILYLIPADYSIEYKIVMAVDDSSIMVTDEKVTVKISLTSPLLREAGEIISCKTTNQTTDTTVKALATNKVGEMETERTTEKNVRQQSIDVTVEATSADAVLLPREPCLQALAELRHAKWFQARATGLQSCVMVIRILRDLHRRVLAWSYLHQWPLELFVEKVIASAGFPISPGDCLRRIMEALASGFLLCGPGLLDPCEKDPQDAISYMTRQQREDLTVSAQLFLRCIAFRQIYKILDMRLLPPLKFSTRPWRLNRKRRYSANASTTNKNALEHDDEELAEPIEKIVKREKFE